MYTIKRTDVIAVTATDGWSATVLVVVIQVSSLLNGSGYQSAADLFGAITAEFAKAVGDGGLARNIQKAAVTNEVPVSFALASGAPPHAR